MRDGGSFSDIGPGACRFLAQVKAGTARRWPSVWQDDVHGKSSLCPFGRPTECRGTPTAESPDERQTHAVGSSVA